MDLVRKGRSKPRLSNVEHPRVRQLRKTSTVEQGVVSVSNDAGGDVSIDGSLHPDLRQRRTVVKTIFSGGLQGEEMKCVYKKPYIICCT